MQAELIKLEDIAQFCATVSKSRGLGRTPGEAVNNLLGHIGDAIPTPSGMPSPPRLLSGLTIAAMSIGQKRSSSVCLISARGPKP